jgi:hypothetical protein
MSLFKKLFFTKLNTPEIRPAKISCICEIPPIFYKNYIECYIGTDRRKGRFADVNVNMCIHCKRKWIRYFVEYEAFSQSGRWYAGIIDDLDLKKITPENAIEFIEGLDWYLYGGSYFSSTGMVGHGKATIDLL